MRKTRYLFVGTWQDFGGHGEGVHVFRIDAETGALAETDHLTGFFNCGILSLAPDGSNLYATLEDKNYRGEWGMGGGILSMAFDAVSGRLTVTGERSAMGACTSYVSVDPLGAYAALTNHGSGLDVVTKVRETDAGWEIVREWDDSTLVLYALREDGGIGELLDLKKSSGHGAIAVRGQLCAHLHSVNFTPDGRWLLACDKGCDRIYVYGVDRKKGKLLALPHTAFAARPGTAPRHLAFHPQKPYFFVNHETTSAVSAYSFDGETGRIRELDYRPMLDLDAAVAPERISDVYGSPADIHVHPVGRFLYSSQRSSYRTGKGKDGISIFRIGEDGRLVRTAFEELKGPCPRGFAIDPEGRFLYVGLQYRDSLWRYRIDAETGALSDGEQVAQVRTPTCLRIADFVQEDKEGGNHGV